MQPIRQIVHDAPEFIAVPPEFRHRCIELIIWPLEEATSVTEAGEPQFLIAEVDRIVIPSREERMPAGSFVDTNFFTVVTYYRQSILCDSGTRHALHEAILQT